MVCPITQGDHNDIIVDIFGENLTVNLYADDVKIYSFTDNVDKTVE